MNLCTLESSASPFVNCINAPPCEALLIDGEERLEPWSSADSDRCVGLSCPFLVETWKLITN